MNPDDRDAVSRSSTAPDASAAFEPLLSFSAVRLRPLWIGVVWVIAGFLLSALLVPYTDTNTARGFVALFAGPTYIYYFMIVHRVVRVLDSQPGWSVEYTPAAAVVKHFIPFYGFYFMYVWPRDVESYIKWRTGKETRVGLWAFLGLLIGLLLRLADPYLGTLIMICSLYILYLPLRNALGTTEPVDMPSPGFNGTLGLR
ncbi:MAG TPA: hypothetical protein VJU82_10525 [Acidobacteriaceae bacterium]|nr:hypothetical protein [Acidobacteriaceae bacterium]